MLAQVGLGAKDNELRVVRHAARGTNRVLKLPASHGRSLSRSRMSSRSS